MARRPVSSLCSLVLLVGALVAPAAASATAPRVPATDRLLPGGHLSSGSTMFSDSGVVRLQLVGGSLILRFGCGSVLWTAPAAGIDALVYSKRGLLKLEDAQGRVIAALGTRQQEPRQLVIQNDGNLVARNATGWYFQTGTHTPPVSPVHPATVAHC